MEDAARDDRRGGAQSNQFTLAEWQQAKRQGQDPRWTKAVLQDCWGASDSRRAFESALQSRGFWLAKGDKRSFVVLDHSGEVHSLPRMLNLKTKEVRARLGDGEDLASVDAAKKTIGERMTPAIRRHVEESRAQFRERSSVLGQYKEEVTELHREQRMKLAQRQDVEGQNEARIRAARLPKGLAALWQRFTGQYQETRAELETEAELTRQRHSGECQALIETQLEQRTVPQAQFKDLRKAQAQQLLELRQDVGRYLRFTRGAAADAPARGRDLPTVSNSNADLF